MSTVFVFVFVIIMIMAALFLTFVIMSADGINFSEISKTIGLFIVVVFTSIFAVIVSVCVFLFAFSVPIFFLVLAGFFIKCIFF